MGGCRRGVSRQRHGFFITRFPTSPRLLRSALVNLARHHPSCPGTVSRNPLPSVTPFKIGISCNQSCCDLRLPLLLFVFDSADSRSTLVHLPTSATLST